MFGIQLIRLLDVLKVNTVRSAVGVSPRSIIITGDDFRQVEVVMINGAPSPDFVVYSKTELVAQVPLEFVDSFITSVAVLSSGLTLTDRSLVQFTFGTRPKKVSGIVRLMQTYLRLLLRTPGTNVFHKRSGGGLIRRVGSNINARSAADVAIAVNSTQQYLVGVQTAERNIPPTERLLSATVAKVNASRQDTSIAVTILLTNHSGQSAAATLTA